MKKYILLIAVCLAGFSASFATGTSLEDLLGTYSCTTDGITASFELSNDQSGYVLEYCRDFGGMECFTEAVYASVVDGEIKGAEGSTHRVIDGLQVEVVESTSDVKIRVSTVDGITLEFTK